MRNLMLGHLVLLLLVGTLTAQPVETDFLMNARQLIYDGKRSGEGYFSKSGRYLIFQAEREKDNPFYQMYILDFETGDIDRVSPGHGKTTCGYFDWSNEQTVLFASSHDDPEARAKQREELEFRASGKQRRYAWDYEPEMDIYTFTKDGQQLANLTNTLGYDAEASFSPDGKWIAFTSNRQAFQEPMSEEVKKRMSFDPSFYNELYIMNADGSNVHRLTHHDGYDGGPFFSPDGKRIIWRRFNQKGDKADIYTMAVDGSDVQQITDFGCMSWAPYYHPSQKYVLFASNKLGFSNFEIFMVDAEGTKEPIQVTYSEGFDGLPVFSPDGDRLVWTSNRTADGNSQLFMANWNHTAALASLSQAKDRPGEVGFSPQIEVRELERKIRHLSSDALGGRMTGSAGAAIAADYIIEQLTTLGLQPLDSTFLVPFSFSGEIEIDSDKTHLQFSGDDAILNQDFTPFLFSDNGSVEEVPVFVGYGLNLPGVEGFNDYLGRDVKGKIVVAIEEIPKSDDDEFDRQLDRYSTVRYRSMLAREAGASAILFIGKKRFQRSDALAASSGILAMRIMPTRAAEWFRFEGQDLSAIEQALSTFNPHNKPTFKFEHPIRLNVELKKEQKQGQNVVALLSASEPSDKYLIVGGHYDHLGLGRSGSLLADNRFDQIHNGADDNASGTALLLELAEYLTHEKANQPASFTANIVFAFWSGEELGLIGSDKFCEELPIERENIKAYLNYDMVGRMKDNRLILQGLGSAEGWKKIVERKNILHGFNLVLQEDPYLPTDATSFYKKQIPVVSFFTGLHEDYHQPSDDADKINYPDLARITAFSKDILFDLLKNDLTYKKVEMSASQQSIRGFSVYLGTIPDYAAEVVGVKLSGVRPGAPSDQAGLQAGDIILELAGKEIRNIYDYTYILGELEVGKKETIVVKRGEKKLSLEITPGRK